MSPPPHRAFGHGRIRRDESRAATSPDTVTSFEQPVRVLHVDDDADLAEMAATYLERADETLTVRTETSARDGLDRLENERVDCIVSDFQMPQMNGLEFLRAVREEDADLPFILFTGQGSEEIASDAIAAGVTDYLQKETGTDQYQVLANRIQNVVERYRVERELDALRGRYELVARASSDAFFDWNLESDDLWWSEGIQQTFGYSSEGVGDGFRWWEDGDGFRWWEERVHPDDRQRVLATMQETFEDGEELLEVAHRFRRADGTYAHIITRGYTVYEAGEPIRMAGTLIDVTERTEREEAVRASERRFRTLTENVTDGVITIDADSTITYANPATAQLFGYSGEELRGEPLTALMPERMRDRHRDGIARYLRTGDRNLDWTGVELPGLCKDGTEIPLAISFGAFERDGQQFFTGVIRDVTERVEREDALQRQTDRLDEFATVLSHDLRSPLNVAVGHLDMARATYDSESLDVVAESLDRMNRLVEDLLTLARGGRSVDEFQPVPLAEVVETATQAVDRDDVAVEVESDLETITGHRSRISVLVENLFRNAVEHGESDVTIRVGMLDGASASGAGDSSTDESVGVTSERSENEARQEAKRTTGGFYVEDDGPGIPEAERQDVLEAGYTTDEDGTGFGLNIVKKIVDAHGWSLTITDGADGGTRIEIANVVTVE